MAWAAPEWEEAGEWPEREVAADPEEDMVPADPEEWAEDQEDHPAV